MVLHVSHFGCAGESTPVLRGPGSTVHAGTLNVGSAVLRVRTTATAGDTAVARMASLVEAAASQQSPAEALVAQVRWHVWLRVGCTHGLHTACVLLGHVLTQ